MSIPDVCTCGRDSRKIHCPFCGRHACYARPSYATKVSLDNGSIATNMNYVCRRCGREFTDVDRAVCAAPSSNITGRARSLKDVTGIATVANPELEGKSREEKMAWVKEQLAKKSRPN